mmetsp:Transcript_92669/g.297787  ORF Transcript_92669/g.297787 Transcript_92669/m.297787 type:complete len:85 (-) Transcript_92669:1640-1894(-)
MPRPRGPPAGRPGGEFVGLRAGGCCRQRRQRPPRHHRPKFRARWRMPFAWPAPTTTTMRRAFILRLFATMLWYIASSREAATAS